MKETYHLSKTEEQIMTKLWMQKEPIRQTQLLEMFNEEGKEWERQTLNTLLIRLENRGFVKREKRMVQAAYSKESFGNLVVQEAQSVYINKHKTNEFKLKNEICEMINKLSVDELYHFVSVLESEKYVFSEDLNCDKCQKIYGECQDDTACKDRFINYMSKK